MLVYQNNPMGILFQEICIISVHVIESDLYLIILSTGEVWIVRYWTEAIGLVIKLEINS